MGDINLEIKIKNLEERTSGEINDTINNIYGTSDQWSSKSSWQVGEICIHDNKLWKCLISNSHIPTEGTEWSQVSLKTILNDIEFTDDIAHYNGITFRFFKQGNLKILEANSVTMSENIPSTVPYWSILLDNIPDGFKPQTTTAYVILTYDGSEFEVQISNTRNEIIWLNRKDFNVSKSFDLNIIYI